jgi:hypothetical protein
MVAGSLISLIASIDLVGLSPVRQIHLITVAISVGGSTEMTSMKHYNSVSMVLESSNNLWNVVKASFPLTTSDYGVFLSVAKYHESP